MIILSQLLKTHVAQNMRDTYNSSGITIALFQNDWDPDCDPLLAAFTLATFSGYAAINVGNHWIGPTYAGMVATTQADAVVTFTHNGGGVANDIYGYLAIRTDSGLLYWAEKNPGGPVNLSSAGQIYTVLPLWQEGQWNLLPCDI